MLKIKIKKSKLKSTSYVVSALLMAVTSTIVLNKSDNAYADKYDDQIRALEAQNAIYSAQSSALAQQALTLANAVADLRAQTAVLQNQVNISQARYDQLQAQIIETEKKIKESQDALGQTLADMYIADDITPIEMIASSQNIGQFLDKQEYRNSIKDSLTSTISEIKSLKTSLEADKTAVAKVLAEQTAQRDELARRQNEQAKLLADTKGQESAYQKLISSNSSKIAEARATQALIAARIANSGGAVIVDSGLLSAYPWNNSNCWMVSYYSAGGADGNGGDGHGYGCRQCASYVAWRIAKEIGLYYSWGNAVNFTSRAKNAGFQEGAAHSGSIAVMDPASAGVSQGHVAWVEAVSEDGRQVLVSQYNFNYGAGYGMYSKMWLSVGTFDHYVRII